MTEQRKVGQRMLRKAYYAKQGDTLVLSSDEKQGEPCWVLWERKGAPVAFEMTGEYRHGIDLDDVNAFRVLEFETTYPVVLVCEEREGPGGAPPETLAVRLQRAWHEGQRSIGGVEKLYWNRRMMIPVRM